MAQLVAHLHGMERVRGSNPLSSTTNFISYGKREWLYYIYPLSIKFRFYEAKEYCPLTKEQITLYKAVADDLPNKEGIERKGLILTAEK